MVEGRSELTTVEGYFFRSRLTDHKALLEQGTATKMPQPEERVDAHLTSAYIVYEALPKWVGNLKAAGYRNSYRT